MKKISPLIAGLYALTTFSSHGYSEETKKPKFALEEVIVTAQKKAESLQDTPISLTAFGEERLEIDGISNLNDIGAKVPSLTIEPFPINNATLRIFIRGVGISDVQVTQDPPVGIYVDGVYIARSTGTALDVAELQRIEVLRGPQGTLYGRNTTGGAINMITKRPSVEALEFKQKFTIGNRGSFTSKTSANIPISDTVAAKVAYLNTRMDGFIENTGPGGDFGDKEVSGYRIDLRWDISDGFTLDYAYDNSDYEYYNYNYQSIRPAEMNKGQAEPVREYSVSQSKYSEQRFDKMETFSPFEASNTEISGHSFILTKDFEQFQLKYIGSYRELYDAAYADLNGGVGSEDYRVDSNVYCGISAREQTGEDCLPLVVPQINQEQFSHELQFTGSFLDGGIDYITGIYYFEEEAVEDNSPVHHQFSSKISEGVFPAPGVGGVLLDGGDVHLVNMLSQRYDVKNTALAAYGQFTWTPKFLDERMHLTFGARLSQDEREALKNQTDKTYIEIRSYDTVVDMEDAGPFAPAFAQAGFKIPGDRSFQDIYGKKDFDDTSFSFIAEFDLTEDINIYGKFVQAYKSGGFNTRDPQRGSTGEPAGTPGRGDDTAEEAPDGNVYGFGFADGFDEEFVASVEFGIKSELMERRLRINANVFASKYTEMQLNFILAGTVADTKVTNAGEAQMQGFETDITFMATEHLLLMLNYAYLDAEVTKAEDEFGNDLSDSFVFYSAPKNSYTFAADWTIADMDWGQLAVNLSYNFMDDRNGGSRAHNAKNTFISSYSLLNGRISLSQIPIGGKADKGNLYIGLWGKNLADEEFEITAIDNLPHSDRSVIWGEPRSFGVDMIYEY